MDIGVRVSEKKKRRRVASLWFFLVFLCVCVCVCKYWGRVWLDYVTAVRMRLARARAHTHTLRIETTTTVYFVCLFVCFYCHSKFSRVRYAARRRRRNRKCRAREGGGGASSVSTYRALVHLLLFLLMTCSWLCLNPPHPPLWYYYYDTIRRNTCVPCSVHTDRRRVSLTRIIRRSYLGCLTFTSFVSLFFFFFRNRNLEGNNLTSLLASDLEGFTNLRIL